jgi:hypothetical protein
MVSMTRCRARDGRAVSGGRRTRRRSLAAALAVLSGCAGLSGCTGDPPESGSKDAEPAALEVRVVSCAGRPDEDTRAAIEAGIGDTLSTYVVAAFLGDYPRDDFVRSFDVFTSGAARLATGDIDLLTASRFSEAEEVRATRLQARISCLVDGDDVIGASARVTFDFEATEKDVDAPRPFSMRGRLLLSQESGTWSVFGYDVARDDVPAAGGRS